MHLSFPRAARRAVPLLAALILVPGLPFAGPASAQDPTGQGAAGKAVKDLFRGKVVSLRGRRVEIAYDFADPAQAEDWSHTYPFLRPATSGGWRVDGKALRGDGNAGWRHRAVFDGELRLSATVSSEDAKNFGAVVLDEDKSQFDLFALADTVFSLLDRKPPLQHMVTTFLPAGQGPGASTEWRYVQTGYEPRIGSDAMDISVRKKGSLNEFRFGTGRLGGADKEARVGPRIVPGFYTLGARVVVTKAVVSGVLDAAWLKSQGVSFEDTVPDDPDPMEAEKPKDPAAPAAAGPDGKPPAAADWFDLYRKAANPMLPKDEREEAADALIETKERRALRAMIDLMYAESDLVGREIGNRVFKAISGKETGFRPDAAREARVRLMPRVWEIWYAVKDQMEKEEKKAKEK